MERFCYKCGFETENDNLTRCPHCMCQDAFVQTKDEEELMRLFKDRTLTDVMLKYKHDNEIEYELKLQQFKSAKEQLQKSK